MVRSKHGIGVSFDQDTIKLMDSVLNKCKHMRSEDRSERKVCELDSEICDFARCIKAEKEPGVFYGQFESRSKFIEYCIDLVISIAEEDKRTLQFLHDFISVLSERPELGPKIAFFLNEMK